MKEIKRMLAVYKQIDLTLRKVALATVVYVEGSAYRRPGARMLVTDDGRWEGAISGGCLEGDALRKARQVMLGVNRWWYATIQWTTMPTVWAWDSVATASSTS